MNSAIIYTKTNCAIALGLKTTQIKQILIDCNPVQVVAVIDGNEHILVVEKYEALVALASTRKERSTNLKVEQAENGTQWKCKGYKITTHRKYIECECKDWQNLCDATGTNQVACKHTYAVLNSLNYESLRDYVASVNNGAIASLHKTFGSKGSQRDYPLAATDSHNLTSTEANIDQYDY